MAHSEMKPDVDFYFKKASWQKELEQLRMIVLDCGLIEELKWGVPCYSFPALEGRKKSNIVLIHVFKEYCALLFFKGALLHDANNLLIQQTKNVQAARQVRFSNVKEIVKLKPILKAYIFEAMEVEKAGLKVTLKKSSEFNIPVEFQSKLNNDPALKTAFYSLTPGRQNGYLLYFSAAKQSKTREARIEKYILQIINGKGIRD